MSYTKLACALWGYVAWHSGNIAEQGIKKIPDSGDQKICYKIVSCIQLWKYQQYDHTKLDLNNDNPSKHTSVDGGNLTSHSDEELQAVNGERGKI